MARQTIEPLVWLLFSAGGVLSALFMPSLALLFGVVFPLGLLPAPDHARVLVIVQHPLTRLVLFALCTLSLFHWAHRFRFTLYDGLQIKHLNELINTLCYGVAIAGSLYAGYLLVRIG
jgi:fumarate reductase subunit D